MRRQNVDIWSQKGNPERYGERERKWSHVRSEKSACLINASKRKRDEKRDRKAGIDLCDVGGEEKMWLIENRLKGWEGEREREEQRSINYWWNKCLTDWLNLALCCFQITQAVRLRAAFVKVQMEIPTGSLMSWFVGVQCKCGPTGDLTCAKEIFLFFFFRNKQLIQPTLTEKNSICNSKTETSHVHISFSDKIIKMRITSFTACTSVFNCI